MSEFKNVSMSESAKEYLTVLSERLRGHFNIFYNEQKGGKDFDMYAFHQNNFFKSFITKSTVYEGFSVFEHMLFRYEKDCSLSSLTDFQKEISDLSPILANPDKFHKKSLVTGILICENEVPSELKKSVEKFFYRKSYKFCFQGWSETICVVVSLSDKLIYIPKGYKSLRKFFAF